MGAAGWWPREVGDAGVDSTAPVPHALVTRSDILSREDHTSLNCSRGGLPFDRPTLALTGEVTNGSVGYAQAVLTRGVLVWLRWSG